MIVSWKWLQRYINLNQLSDAEVAERLSLSGLNHESTQALAGDWAIDLEVTSNRPDCLAHVGVAREIGVLFDRPLQVPDPQPPVSGPAIQSLTYVQVDCPELCPRYTARLIRGVKIGPSPAWLQELLANATGDPTQFKSINNVADITNFVMLECGQPLHAFDFDQLREQRIVVRAANEGEVLEAIDHKTYSLQAGMCVIADAQRPVALAGIMGGAATEITERTVNVLIESAEFAPGSVRHTSRRLKLSSDSSYRFERTVDPVGIDWASRRCCQLILEHCGGQLCSGVIDVGASPIARAPIRFRLDQIARILGIEIPPATVRRILEALGLHIESEPNGNQVWLATPPAWRRDLSREADLVEEVARIHGYDKIPEDHAVPMAVSQTTPLDISSQRVRGVLTAAGLSEALSPSLVPAVLSDLYSPWSNAATLSTLQPMLGVLDTKFWNNAGPVDCVRRSLIPSLLELRRINEFRHNLPVELFEIAKVYLPGETFPVEPTMIGVCSGRSLLDMKSVMAEVFATIQRSLKVRVEVVQDSFFSPGRGLRYWIGDRVFGLLGEISRSTQKKMKLRQTCVVGEFFLESLVQVLQVIPQSQRQSLYPAIERDLNFILDTKVRWSELEATVRAVGGVLLENVAYRETYVDAKRDGEGKKRVLLTMTLRSLDETLTGKQADDICQKVIGACTDKLAAKLVAG
ncbi:MAG: phenylalanine--tRNA ligase subunit beta [Planctomycetaceae bacterium]|nr:phenylalanine--tRNA ligase subunit beta [Planctomycetaceae bacterium]